MCGSEILITSPRRTMPPADVTIAEKERATYQSVSDPHGYTSVGAWA
jgi:hypothetical protein